MHTALEELSKFLEKLNYLAIPAKRIRNKSQSNNIVGSAFALHVTDLGLIAGILNGSLGP